LSNAAVLLGQGEDGAVKLAAGNLEDAEFQPFGHMFLHFLSMGTWNFIFLHVDGFLGLQGDLVEQGVGLAEVKLVLSCLIEQITGHVVLNSSLKSLLVSI
jgi:hypothetical protein